MARENQKIVVLYYIGTDYAERGISPVFEVKGRSYPEPDATGVVPQLKIGDAIQVIEGDVPYLMDKATKYVSGVGQVIAFTQRADIAAAVKAQYESGKAVKLTDNPSLSDMLSIAPTEDVKREIASKLSVEDLQRMLAEKQASSDVPSPVAAVEPTPETTEVEQPALANIKRPASKGKQE